MVRKNQTPHHFILTRQKTKTKRRTSSGSTYGADRVAPNSSIASHAQECAASFRTKLKKQASKTKPRALEASDNFSKDAFLISSTHAVSFLRGTHPSFAPFPPLPPLPHLVPATFSFRRHSQGSSGSSGGRTNSARKPTHARRHCGHRRRRLPRNMPRVRWSRTRRKKAATRHRRPRCVSPRKTRITSRLLLRLLRNVVEHSTPSVLPPVERA